MKLINGWTKEKVRSHLSQNFQGKSAYFDEEIDGEVCRYRIGDKKCVVGCFIPYEKYHKSMEGLAASSIIQDNKISKLMPLKTEDMNLWQTVHDDLNSEDPIDKQINDLMEYIN